MENMVVHPAGNYDAALWRRTLSRAGVLNPATGEPYTEAMLAGLAGGIGFMMFTFEYRELTTATVITRFHPGPYVGNLIERCGAVIEQQRTSSARVAAARLDAALDAGHPVVVRVTKGALPWHDGTALENMESTDIAVTGREGGEYLLDDGGSGSVHGDTGTRRIDAADLAAARGHRTKDRFWQASVTGPGAGSEEHLAGHVRTAVAQTAGTLLGTVPLEGIPLGAARNFGIEGIRTWAGRLRDDKTKKGWPAMFAAPERLGPGLKMVRGFLHGSQWGGPGALRPLYADFLHEAGQLPGIEDPRVVQALSTAVPLYRELGERWAALASLVDPETAAADRFALFAAMAALLDELADGEHKAAGALSGIGWMP